MYVCLDIETTGLDPKGDHIIEVAIVTYDDDKIIDEWSSLVKPTVSIPEFTTRLTGITNEMVADAPILSDIADTIREKVGDKPVMGHFIFFDLNFLSEKNVRLDNTQLDSCQLAQVLLHDEPSYSLQVLGEKLNITHEDAHRALDDVKANIELFWKLTRHVRALKPEEKEALKPLLQKSSWPWAETVLRQLDLDGGELIEASESGKTSKQSESHVKLAEITPETPFLFEEPSHTYQDLLDYALGLEGQSLITIPNLKLFPQNEKVGILKDPYQYIDEERLDQFLAKEKLDITETMLGLKMKLWLFVTQTGEQKEIKLVKEEKGLWNDICCQEGDDTDSFFNRAKTAALKKEVLVIDHLHFLKDRSRSHPTLDMPKNVIVGQSEAFIKTVEYAWHIRLDEGRFLQDLHKLRVQNPDLEVLLDNLAAKVSILFGFIGMVMQKHGIPDDPRHPIVIESFHRNTAEWSKVKDSANSIENSLAAMGNNIKAGPRRDEFERYLRYLTKILHTPGPILWMTQSREELPIVNAFPDQPSTLFTERIWKDIDALHLFCHHGDLNDDFSFLKSELGLGIEVSCQSADKIQATPIALPDSPIANPKSPQNIPEVTQELSKRIPSIDGNIFILVNSMRTGEQLFYSMKELSEETERPLYVQNLSGGLGKIMMLSKKTDGQNIYVGNQGMLHFLLDNDVNLQFLAIHRLPFAYPNDPITKARSNLYRDPYKDYSLPQAALRFQGIINTFLGNEWEGKNVLVLDPRINDYGSIFF